MLQTLTDSRAPLVLATTVGSFGAMVAVVSIPGLSHAFGCTPVDPVGWGQGFAAALVASGLAAVAPWLLARVAGVLRRSDDGPGPDGPGAGSVVDDDHDAVRTRTA